jgi:hypothetical protein
LEEAMMTPNLTRLFATANNRSGSIPIDVAFSAEHRLKILLLTHGEALVEALEYYAEPARWGPVTQLVSRPSTEKARALLAALEKESEEANER